MKGNPSDRNEPDERYRELVDGIKSAWGRPELSDSERRSFDKELAGRLEGRRGLGPLGMALAGAISLVAVLFILQAEWGLKEGPQEADQDSEKGQSYLIRQPLPDAAPRAAADWMDSLVSPVSDRTFLGELAQEYQAIATWLSMDDSAPGRAAGSVEAKEGTDANQPAR